MSIQADSLIATNKFHHKLGKLIEPLEPYFGIKQFCYYKLFSDGTATYINTDIKLIEHFAYNNLYTADPHQVAPDNMGSGFVGWKTYKDYSSVVDMMAHDFDVSHGLSYIIKGTDSYEAFAFSAPESSDKTQARLQNDSKYLLKFIDYLKMEAAPMFEQSNEQHRINIASIKDVYYTQKGLIPNEEGDRNDLVNFLVSIGLVDPKLTNVVLTPQEKRCVRLCIEGKSAKQIGRLLELSYRTVESYLETIKEKLGIYYKRELFDLKDSLLELGILD